MEDMQRPMTATTRRSFAWLGLFASSTTLVCCAIPILLVAAGFGTTVAALTDALPGLVLLSVHKSWTFSIAATVLALAWWAHRRDRSCPTDPELAAACERTRRWNQRALIMASVLWLGGFTAAFLALPVLRFLQA
jgi:mercuric ion transport protein